MWPIATVLDSQHLKPDKIEVKFWTQLIKPLQETALVFDAKASLGWSHTDINSLV